MDIFKKRIFFPTSGKKAVIFLFADAVLVYVSVYLSFLLRFDGAIPDFYFGAIKSFSVLSLIFYLPVFYFHGLYYFSLSYISARELVALAKSSIIGFLFLGASLFILRNSSVFMGFPRSTFFISTFLIFILCGGIRFGKRVYSILFKSPNRKSKEKTLIVGAGDAGEQILRSMLNLSDYPYSLIGFIDDNPSKKGVLIHGLKVLGGIDDIPQISAIYKINSLIIALPSAGSSAIKRAVEKGREAGINKIKIAPLLSEIINGNVSVKDLKELDVEDLLNREAVQLDTSSIKNFISGKIILITGAAGSIGFELCRQTAKFRPSLLLLLDQDETGIFNILEELKAKFFDLEIKSLIADIRDEEKIKEIFKEFKPNVVFHVAAYKHVPLMERHPDEAVKNNIFGTKIVAQAALNSGAEKFIFISTDKAVNPTSIMGATKKVGEMICQTLNQKNHTKFISVRFGNVLDSRGSVIPTFREQIKKGGPVEVTHPEMKRYFMLISEACLLVMQAGAMGLGGEVFVLDMGKPIRILDLAKEMIRLSGFEPDRDIPIVFSGVRPGEKLFEEILTVEEGAIATQNQKIFMVKFSKIVENKLKEGLDKLKLAVSENDKNKITKIFKDIVPYYKN